MAVTGTIASGKIDISIAGFDSVKAQLDKLRTQATAAFEKFKSGGGGKGLGAAFSMVSAGVKSASGLLSGMFNVGTKVFSMFGRLGGPVVGVAFHLIGKIVGEVAGKLGELAEWLVKVGTKMVAVADPVRFAIFGAHVTSTYIIIGKMLIPILQVAISAVERFNNALRSAGSGGGFSTFVKHVAEILDRVVTSLLPIFSNALKQIDAAWQRLIPDLDEFAAMIDEIMDGFADMDQTGDGLFSSLITAAEELIRAGLKLAVVFGPALAGWLALAVKLVGALASAIAGALTVVSSMAEAMRSAFDAAADAIVSGINKVIQAMNFAIQKVNDWINKLPGFVKDGLSLGEIPTIDEIRRSDNGKRNKDRGGEGEGRTNTPLIQRKPEFMGVEEAFKKAQQATVLTPQMIMDRERLGLERDQLATQKQIAANTSKRAEAHEVGGDS